MFLVQRVIDEDSTLAIFFCVYAVIQFLLWFSKFCRPLNMLVSYKAATPFRIHNYRSMLT